MRHWWLAALVLLSAPALAQPMPVCAFGDDPDSYREEAYCAAQVSLRSTIARSFALLAARTAASDGALGVAVRRAQDSEVRVDLLTRQERQARAGNGDTASLAQVSGRLDAATAERDAARAVLERDHPAWVALTRTRPLSEAQTRVLLRKGEVLVFWQVAGEATFVFAMDRAGATWERIPLTRAALERAVAGLRDTLGVSGPVRGALALSAGNRSAAALQRQSGALYRQLFPGRVQAMVRRARTLLLVPSGPLSALPFAALATGSGDDPRWLGLRKPIALLPSPIDLRTLRGRPSASASGTPFVGFGAPLLTGSGGIPTLPTRGSAGLRAALADLPALPEAEGELRALANVTGAGTAALHLGAAATERAVKAADLSAVRILAFATHGLVAGEIEGVNEGALVFTPPSVPDASDDGLLTASEAAQLRLDADWVLLSACSTAAGDRIGGEALSGLAAAFGYAGARALLVSHWQVRDDAARRLTTLAVTERRLGRGEALRRAMVSVAKDRSHPDWHHPAIWAVMTLIGDPAG